MISSVSKNLLRSFLRFSRKPVLKFPFILSSSDFKVSDILGIKKLDSVKSLKDLIRDGFRLNETSNFNDGQKLDIAFAALKSLEDIEKKLNGNYNLHIRNSSKEYNTKAVFRIGSIVRHKTYHYRGVVCDWEITSSHDKLNGQEQEQIVDILVDINDSQTNAMGSLPPKVTVTASQLELITDPAFCRVQHFSINDLFTDYCDISNSFVPNSVLRFAYPRDCPPIYPPPHPTLLETSTRMAARVHSLGLSLQSLLYRELESGSTDVTDTLETLLSRMVATDASAHVDAETGTGMGCRPSGAWRVGYESLRALCDTYSWIDQILQLRYQANGIAFLETLSETDGTSVPAASWRLGQVVRHKKFSYRGVVVGWDQRPHVDVGRWQAVIGLPSGREQPFYRVIPDESDVESFLGEGQYRHHFYVAQENLDKAAPGTLVRHRRLAEFFPAYNHKTGFVEDSLTAHSLFRFCFPQSSDGDAYTADGQKELETFVSLERALLAMFKQLKMEFCDMKVNECEDLYSLLRLSRSHDTSLVAEKAIWMGWMAHRDGTVSRAMRLGLASMNRGSYKEAKKWFQLAARTDTNYAEPLNKLAAIFHSTGEAGVCLAQTAAAMTLAPNHFGAIGGRAMALNTLGQKKEAVEAYRRVLELHPWSALVPSQLASLQKDLEDPLEREEDPLIRS